MELLPFILCILIAVPAAFFISRIAKGTAARAVVLTLLCVLLTPLFYFITIFAISDFATTVNEEKFDRTQWFSNKSGRYKYSVDLGSSDLLNGKTSKEVLELLGEPENNDGKSFTYDLSKYSWRQRYGLSVWLDIKFENDTVISHEAVYD